jgi:hypothetical protein
MWGRPYTVTNGRTRPTTDLDLMSLVKATGRANIQPDQLGYEHAMTLQLCSTPIAVVEVAAHLHQPTNIAKVLLADLIALGAVITRPPQEYSTNPETLEALLVGLRNI